MTFEELNLNGPLLRALEDLRLSSPTTIQHKVFPVVMSGKDVTAIAQTGTGKTFAYLLPSLRQWQYSKEKLPQILVLVPTRELVAQVAESARQLSAYLNLTVVGVYGGANMNGQIAEVNAGCDLLVATPGRLADILLAGALKTKSIKKLVIDEVDEMLNLGFRKQLENILDLLPPKRQNLLFSATMTDEVGRIIQDYFNSPVTVEAAPAGTPLDSIDQHAYPVPNFYTKVNLLKQKLHEDASMTKVLVFAATKEMADRLHEEMEARFPGETGVIHSNKSQNYRFASVRNFQEGVHRVLIATDVIARGLDVAGVSHVINLDVPDEPENYIHRIGRTGRAGQRGNALTFFTEKEEEALKDIEQLMNYVVPVLPLPADLEISEVLTEEEMPKVFMPEVKFKLPPREERGPAFHEKLAKNSKVNVRRNIAEEKRLKYGRPIKRSGKK